MGLHIVRPFLLHQILTLTLFFSCRALTQHSRNHHTGFTDPEAGKFLHQPSSDPRTYNLRSILVHHSPSHPTIVQCIVHCTLDHPSPNPHLTINQPSSNHHPGPHWTHTVPALTLTEPLPNPLSILALPSSYSHPTLFLPLNQPSHIYSRPSPASNNRYLSIK